MNSGFYSACAGLVAQSQALELTANNIANVNTAGYRGQQMTFRSVLEGTPSTLISAVNQLAEVGGVRTDETQGVFEKTGNSLDIAIEGPAMLAVQTSDGQKYTRNGNLKLNKDRVLTTSFGDVVQGEGGAAIMIPAGNVSISNDGTISVGGAIAGKLKLVEFASGTSITKVGNSYYSAPDAAVQASSRSTVLQGSIESSNVNPVAATVQVIGIQRSAEMMTRAMSILHSEFNRLAVEELPKV